MSEFIQGFQTTEGEKKYDYNALGNLPDLTISKDDITGALGFVPPSKAEVEASVKVASDAAATADNKAVAAQTTANQAVGAAQQAQSTADDAVLAAQNAQNRADDAHERIDDSQTQIVQGSIITIDDCDSAPLQNLRIFGKTTQNGTPTPEAPVPLESVGDDGNVNVIVGGKNLFDTSRCRFYRSNGEDSTVGTAAIVGNNIILTKTTSNSFFYGMYIDVVVGQKYIISHGGGANKKGDSNSVYVYSDKPYGNRIAQANSTNPTKATFTATTPTIFVGLYMLSDTEVGEDVAYPNVQLELGASVTEYEFGLPLQEITVQPPNGLPGIPVTSGGNYTDGDGQQWICDEVDFEKGVYVQRILQTVFNSSDGWSVANADGNKRRFYNDAYRNVLQSAKDNYSKANLLCSNFLSVTGENTWFGITGINISNSGRIFLYHGDIAQTAEALGEYFTNYPTTFMAELAQENHIPLSEIAPDALAQYAALHTNYPNSTVFNDGNAHMEVKYATPTTVLPLSGGRMNGSIDMVNHQLTGLPTPKNNTDAVSLEYLQETKLELAQGINDVSDIAYGAQETADEALEEAVDAHERIDDSQVQVIKGEIVSVENSADAPLQGLRIFGKTVQNGTPTPEAPIPLESVGENVNVIMCGKNFADNKVYKASGQSGKFFIVSNDVITSPIERPGWSGVSVIVPVLPNTVYTCSSDVTPNRYLNVTFYPSVEDVVSATNAISYSEEGNANTIKVTTPIGCYCMVVTALSGEKATYTWNWWQVEKGNMATDYEPFGFQKLTLSTPNGLPGIPVTSGGNYTDENGQQWICDEVDFARGVYIQNVQKVILDGTESWRTYGTFGYYFEFADIESNDSPMGVSDGSKSEQRLMCSHFAVQPKYVNVADRKHGMTVIYCNYNNGKCRIAFDLEGTTMATYAAEQYAAGNPVTVLYQRAVPIETALSEEELTAYAALHTNYPNSTVFNDGNAHMEVKYATPTTALPLTGGRYKVATPYAPTDAVPKSYADRIDKKVDTLREVVSSFHSNIVQEASGEVIQVHGSAEAPLAGLKVFGKTEQMTTTGKNLLNQHSSNWQSEEKTNGITYTYVRDSDGNLLYINADGPNTTTSNSHAKKAFTTLPAGTYTVTGCPSGYGSAVSLRVGKGASGTYMEVDQGNGCTFTLTEETIISINPMVGAGKTVSNVKFYPMIRLATITDGTYEPYTGGIPSPNPEYPQKLESVGDSGSVAVTVCGKNLLNFPDVEPYLNNGITWSCKDGVVHAKGASTAISYSSDYINMNIAGLVGTFYKSSPVNGCSLMCQVVKNGETTWLPNPITLDGSESSVLLYYQCPVGTTVDSDLYPMLSISEEDLQWEPYKEVQTLPFSTPNGLPGIPVPSGGNYTDSTGQQWICDEVDFEKGVYVQRIGKINTADVTCTKSSISNPNGTVFVITVDHSKNHFMWETRLKTASISSATLTQFISAPESSVQNRHYIRFVMEETNTTDANTRLRTEASDIIYALGTPIETALSAEQLEQFSALHTNYPNTTIFNDGGAGMEVKYVADTKMYVDKKFEELAKILVNKL